MEDVIEKFKQWRADNPDESYQYDEIHEFLANLTRSEMMDFMLSVDEWREKAWKYDELTK